MDLMTLNERVFHYAPLRTTDLPYRRLWGFWIRFFKTFEVLLFKCLQWLDLYRPQKSIVGIPGIAAQNFTLLQALVYNGTQDEVLGFRPRRLLHRILKGLPDLEMFERIRFQLSVSEQALRSVEASTETRGFVHLHLPWQLPWYSPEKAWLRMSPVGVETLLGRIQLGDYEVISSPIFFVTRNIRYLIVSDIDDTIKDSKIGESTSLRQILSGIFRGHYYRYEAISGMAELYQKLVEKNSLIIYLTSTPCQLAPFLMKFLKQCGFPDGPIFVRWLGYGRMRHKWRMLHRLLSNLEDQRCVLIGDSGEQDLQIYRRVYDNDSYGNKVDKVLIRHLPGTPVQKPIDPRESFYKEISELRDQLAFILEEGAPVDKTPPVIIKVDVPDYGSVIIETSDKVRYFSDLSSLAPTYCYPKSFDQWQKVSIDSHGLALVWENRFEAHIDQIIGLANKREPISESVVGGRNL